MKKQLLLIILIGIALSHILSSCTVLPDYHTIPMRSHAKSKIMRHYRQSTVCPNMSITFINHNKQ